jgi:localization factor PodJL
MRAELPWNVAGIPPEAREAARAAARREGLSVGEWLTRRILRSFSDMGEDPQPLDRLGTDRLSLDRATLDPWGLPPSSASRRDSEDMLARVSRSEAESSDATRRIEEQLRTVARRLDSAERSQSENNRAMSKTASEINIATREQSQAFDQLGTHVMNLSDRMERLERSAAQDGLKDAVKALHQGLSRLADQITQTANQSATQVSALTGNMEQLAGRVGQVRSDVESNTQALEQLTHRVGQVRSDIEAATQPLEQRLGSVEKASQFNTNALDHALERLEAQANIRAGDLAEAQKRETQSEVTIMRLEENLSRLEAKGHDPALDRRLEGIDRALGDIVTRLESQADPFEESVRALTRRIDTVEKGHNELMAELRANLHRPAAQEPPSFDPAPQFAAPSAAFAPPPHAEAPAFEAPPFAEPASAQVAAFGSEGFDASAFPPGFNAADPFAGGFAPDNFAAPAFDAPGFAPSQDYADPATGENFLSAARRSAQAAAQTETQRKSAFSWGASQPGAAAHPRPHYLIPAIIGFIVLLALAAGLVLSQRMKASAPVAPAIAPKSGGTATVAPPTQTDTTVTLSPTDNARPFVPAPQSGSSTGPKRTVLPLAQQPVNPAPVHPVSGAPATAPQAATTPATTAPAANAGDRVTQLANAGNPVAETILGLKYLDGQGVPVDLAQAGKWLARAADHGNAVAQYRLGTMYERGQGTAADPAKATKWYQAAANQGNRKAMHNLAVAFADGAAGKKDMAEAARWFSKAAALGLSDSQFNLAVLYERGDGVPQSLIDAYKWYAIASAAGDAESKQRLTTLQTQLSDADRATAQKSAASFHAAPLGRSANVPPEASDLPAN